MIFVKTYIRVKVATGEESVCNFTMGHYPAMDERGVPVHEAARLVEMWNRGGPHLWTYHIALPERYPVVAPEETASTPQLPEHPNAGFWVGSESESPLRIMKTHEDARVSGYTYLDAFDLGGAFLQAYKLVDGNYITNF